MNAFSSTSRDALQDALSVIVARTSVLGTRIRAALEADQADDMQHLGKRVHFATRYFIALGEFGFDFPLPSEPLAACDSIEEETRMWDIAAQVLRERTVDWLQEDGVPGILALRLKLDWDFLLPAGWDSSQFDAIIRAKDGYSLASELTTMPQAPDTHSVKDAFNEILQNSGMATTEQDDPKDRANQDTINQDAIDHDTTDLPSNFFELLASEGFEDGDEYADFDDDFDDEDFDDEDFELGGFLESSPSFTVPGDGDPLDIFVHFGNPEVGEDVEIEDLAILLDCQADWANIVRVLSLQIRVNSTEEGRFPDALAQQDAFIALGAAYSLIARLDTLMAISRTESSLIRDLEKTFQLQATKSKISYADYLEENMSASMQLFKDSFHRLISTSTLNKAKAVELTESFIDWSTH